MRRGDSWGSNPDAFSIYQINHLLNADEMAEGVGKGPPSSITLILFNKMTLQVASGVAVWCDSCNVPSGQDAQRPRFILAELSTDADRIPVRRGTVGLELSLDAACNRQSRSSSSNDCPRAGHLGHRSQ